MGKELALRYASLGAIVVLGARRVEILQDLERECRRRGAGDVLLVQCDVSIEQDCKQLIGKSIEKFGDRIDLLILAAGVGLMENFEDARSLDNYRKIMDVNLFGAVACVHYALPALKRAQGHICAISSLQGKFSVPGRTGYSASKHAMVGFFHALRVELKNRVGVTLVYPGYVYTEFQTAKLKASDGSDEDGEIQRNRSKYMSVEECARQIMEAVLYDEDELVMTLKGNAGAVLQGLLPRSLMDKITASTSKAAVQRVTT